MTMNKGLTRSFTVAALAVSTISACTATPRFDVRYLVSDGAVPADHIDANLVNPWGISLGPTSAFWISDNGTGLSTLYDGNGNIQSLVVSIPPPQSGTPSGTVFYGGSGFVVSEGGKSGPSRFIFVSEDGKITGWSPGVDLHNAITLADNGLSGAKYKGVALAQAGGHDYLYAANFTAGVVEMYDSSMSLVRTFTDPKVGFGYAPFNVQAIGDELVVTFALRGPTGDDVAGYGHGYVDVFSTSGHLLRRIARHGALNSPWGVALAPKSWGSLAGRLLVGNFGDGRIHAYRLHGDGDSDDDVETLRGTDHRPIVIEGLWALMFGLGGKNSSGVVVNGMPDELFFTAGVNHEADGAFGKIIRSF